jgi:hypothetical protein
MIGYHIVQRDVTTSSMLIQYQILYKDGCFLHCQLNTPSQTTTDNILSILYTLNKVRCTVEELPGDLLREQQWTDTMYNKILELYDYVAKNGMGQMVLTTYAIYYLSSELDENFHAYYMWKDYLVKY